MKDIDLNDIPRGSYISRKTIKGKVQNYLQWNENGKKKSKYINDNNVKLVESYLYLLKNQNSNLMINEDIFAYFNSTVLVKDDLKTFVENVKEYKKRKQYFDIINFLTSKTINKVFVLYGLRRTGKTTLLKQTILNMDKTAFNKTAFIQIHKKDTMSSLNKDLHNLIHQGYKYFFIDEITLIEDFIDGSSLLPDVYANNDTKIFLTGTDSLGFMIAANYELYDRVVMSHTTFISYKEFEDVLGIKGIDNYIEYGGTMSISGNHYNESIFASKTSIDEYIDSSICHNIQHSLEQYQNSSHFRNLKELYLKNELTGAINRVIEDMNHYFTIDVLTRDFKSSDLSISSKNLRNDRDNPNNILDNIDIKQVTQNIKRSLEIKNKNEQHITIHGSHVKEIEEYLYKLELIDYVNIKDINNNVVDSRVVFVQPGMRYCQAKTLISSLMNDEVFSSLSINSISDIKSRILSEIKGRMMEDIILLECKKTLKEKEIFKLHFDIGEYDLVIFDPNNLSCEIYEIKHSSEIVDNQYRFLIDEEKNKKTEFRYGRIKSKNVIYNGISTVHNNINYINVEEFLKSL